MFKTIDPRQYAALRIVYGVLALASLFNFYDYASFFYSDKGWLPSATAIQLSDPSAWSLLYTITSPQGVRIFIALLITAAIFMIIGYRTRLSILVVFIGLISIHYRNWWADSGEDSALRIMIFYLIFAACGEAWSVDSLIRNYRAKIADVNSGNFPEIPKKSTEPKPRPAWPLIALQIQVCFIYCMTGIMKETGTSWSQGSALYFVLMNRLFAKAVLGNLAHNSLVMAILSLMTKATLFWELTFPLLILNKWTRWAALAIGVFVHTGIVVLMQAHWFGFIMMATYIAFLPGNLFAKFENWARSKLRTPPSLRAQAFFDRNSQSSVKWTILLNLLDFTDKVEWVPQNPPTDFSFLPPNGKILTGTDAMDAVIRTLPSLFFVRILTVLPGFSRLVSWTLANSGSVSTFLREFFAQ